MARGEVDRRAHAVLMEALDLAGAARASCIDSACGADAALKRRVLDLVAALESSRDFLETPALGTRAGGRAPAGAVPAAHLADRVPGYLVQRIIASGGMASVYEAQQVNPRRTVALKVMRHGLGDPASLLRFRFETEVLARLDHPGIAQIFEAGAFEDGRGASIPFFAMEFIRDARPITEYAAAAGLGVADRLRLFCKVCDAVHHGHQLGVIHRDLKPGNILVDGSGRVKVIDFGIARPSADEPWITESLDRAQVVGTLQTMSPEQCSRDRAVDIRTDVYSLGIVLYELVTGRAPFEFAGVPAPVALREIEQGVRQRPSAVSAALRGDIDAIVMRAVELQPSRRYPTVSELASDVRRHLDHEPIQARPATTIYQFRKFARRHRGPVGAAAAVVGVLVAGVVAASLFAVVANRAKEESERQRGLADAARAEAEREAGVAREINAFWIDIIERGSPYEARRPDLTVREALDAASVRVDGGFSDAGVKGLVHLAFADAYHALGLWDEELAHAEAARASGQGGAASALALARALIEHDRFDEARALIGAELASGAARPAGADRAALLAQLARAEERAGELERALAMRDQVDGLAAGGGEQLALSNRAARARLLVKLGRAEEAVGVLEEVAARQRELLGEDHPDAMDTLNITATARHALGRFEEAERDLRSLESIALTALGEGHAYTLLVRNNLASVLREQGKSEDAEAMHRAVYAALVRRHGADDAAALVSAQNLGTLLSDMERYEEAESMLADVAARRARLLGPDHADTLNSLSAVGRIMVEQGRYEQAQALYGDLLSRLRRSVPAGSTRLAPALRNYAVALSECGRDGDALPMLIESHDILLAAAGPGHPQTIRGGELVCEALDRLGRAEEAAAWRAKLEARGAANAP